MGGAMTASEYHRGTRYLLAELRQRRRPLLRMAGWSALELLPVMLGGWLLSRALDGGFLAGAPIVGTAWLALLGVALVARAFAERAMFPHLADLVEPMRNALVHRVVSATLSAAVERRPGAIDAAGVSRLTTQVESVRGLVSALLRTARPLATSVLGVLFGLALLNLWIVVLVLPFLVLALLAFPLTVRALARRTRQGLRCNEEVAAGTGAALLAARDVTALGAEEVVSGPVRQASAAQASADAALGRVSSVRALLVLVGGYLPLVLLLFVAPRWVADGRLSAGEIAGAVVYLTVYLVPALQLLTSAVCGYWTQLIVVLARLVDTFPPSPVIASREAEPDATPLEVPTVELVGVSFAYGPTAAPVLNDLHLSVPAGDHLAVVGPSGVGKSTLTRVLTGLETPVSGEVRLGGRPIGQWPTVPLRRLLALIPQEAYVFPGTLAENLRYLAPAASESQLSEVVELLGLAPVVRRLGGFGSELADPLAALSAGERQLVALARVYLSPARVVMLDEGTCHLDPVAEERAELAFAARAGTLIVVAHRLSSAARARRVLFIEDAADGQAGTRVSVGSHAELLAGNSRYARLHQHWGAGVG